MQRSIFEAIKKHIYTHIVNFYNKIRNVDADELSVRNTWRALARGWW